MSVQHGARIAGETRTPSGRPSAPVTIKAPDEAVEGSTQSVVTSVVARRFLALLRIGTGFVFLWAFLDKTFGLGFSTTSEKAWIHGGSPTKGFLGSVDVGPFVSLSHAMAGTWWANWLFMLGMLAVGVAIMAGIAMWPAAVAGALLVLMMWSAEFPPARFTTSGDPSGSTNPFVDYHIVYALALLALAATSAGATWGLTRYWKRLPYIKDHAWTHRPLSGCAHPVVDQRYGHDRHVGVVQAIAADRTLEEPVDSDMLTGAHNQQLCTAGQSDQLLAGLPVELGQGPVRLRPDGVVELCDSGPFLLQPRLLVDKRGAGDTEREGRRRRLVRMDRHHMQCCSGPSCIGGCPLQGRL